MSTQELRKRLLEDQFLREQQGTFVRRERRYCRHDQRYVEAIAPARFWRWLLPGLSFLGFLALVATVFIDPFGLLALLIAGLVIAALGPYVAMTRRAPVCPHCRREVPYRTKEEAEAAEGPVRAPTDAAPTSAAPTSAATAAPG